MQVTVGGISSGAYHAVQYHVSHSTTVAGVAAFAGGPFYCAEDTTVLGAPRVDFAVIVPWAAGGNPVARGR